MLLILRLYLRLWDNVMVNLLFWQEQSRETLLPVIDGQ